MTSEDTMNPPLLPSPRPKTPESEQTRIRSAALDHAREAATKTGVDLIEIVSQGTDQLATAMLTPPPGKTATARAAREGFAKNPPVFMGIKGKARK